MPILRRWISPRYFIIELTTAIMFVAMYVLLFKTDIRIRHRAR